MTPTHGDRPKRRYVPSPWFPPTAAELRDTMVTFLRHNQQMQRTAQELNIHVNTLYLRLESITELFGEAWRTPQQSLSLRLALEISDLASRAIVDG